MKIIQMPETSMKDWQIVYVLDESSKGWINIRH